MRIIKFRAFDDGKMIYENNILHLNNEDNLVLRLAKFWCNIRNDSHVMQFTGLHDKNGKEIYEGDIVTDGVGKYKIVYDLKLAGYQPYCIFRDDPENYCEVIGNIYENPELISKTPTHEH